MNGDAIIVQGAVETAEVVEASCSVSCKNCGHVIKIVGGIVATGSAMNILGENQKNINCPSCGSNVELNSGG